MLRGRCTSTMDRMKGREKGGGEAARPAGADHLFISYAWEDGALAEWLALKLTAAGYHPSLETRTQNPSRLGYTSEGEISNLRLFRQSEVCGILAVLPFKHREKKVKAQFVSQNFCSEFFGTRKVEGEDWTNITAKVRLERDNFVRAARDSFHSYGPYPMTNSQQVGREIK